MDLHWQNIGDEPALSDYWIHVDFVADSPGAPVANEPAFSWDFPPAKDTSLWQTGFVVKEEGCYFRVPADIPTGRYVVLISLFDRSDPACRIPLRNKTRDVGGHRYRVGQVSVVSERGLPPKVLAYRLVWRVREPRPAPAVRESVFVSYGRLSVGFDPTRPAIRAWRVSGQDLPLGGDETLSGPEAEFVSVSDGRRRTSLAVGADWIFQCRISGDAAVYKCRLRWKQAEVARFDLRFQVGRASLTARVSAVQESPGFQLLSITGPAIVSVPETASGATLALSSRGGRLVNLADSGRHRQVHKLEWDDPLPGAMAVCDDAIAVAWVHSADDRLVSEVSEAECKRGSLGIRFRLRHEVAANNFELLTKRNSEFEVAILTGQEKLTWTDGATWMSKNFRARPAPMYIGSLIYRFDCTRHPGFEQACESAYRLIRRVHALTDGAPQIVYLEGCQISQERHRAAVRALQARAQERACKISIVGPVKSAAVTAAEDWIEASHRIAGWLQDAQITETVALNGFTPHPDGFSGNAVSAFAADETIAAGRQLVDVLKSSGIDVSGGPLVSPLVGAVTHYWDLNRAQAGGPYSSEECVPLVPFVLHGRITYGTSIDDLFGAALALLYGATWTEHWTEETADSQICQRYYFITLPWARTASSLIREYRRDGDWQRLTYENGETVEANLTLAELRVSASGYPIIQNDIATVPLGRHRLAVYSKAAERVCVPLPPGWSSASRPNAEALHSDGSRTPVDLSSDESSICLEAPGGVPVIIHRR